MKKNFVRIDLSDLKNETHVQFNEGVDLVFVRHNPQGLGIHFLYEPYKRALNSEVEALDIITKSKYTVEIFDVDRFRDKTLRGFTDSVKGAMQHYEPSHSEAAGVLYNVFSHYGNIAKKTLDDETAAINDLVRELNLPENANAVALLGFQGWQSKLVEENNRFVELMERRYSETADKTPIRMKTARRETDKYYHAIISQLENQILGGMFVNEIFIRELNAHIERFKHILAQEIGERKQEPKN
jgi:hypothetical protein